MRFRFLLVSLFAVITLMPVSGNKKHKTILLLHSYNQGLKWTDNLNQAIVDKIEADPEIQPDFLIEYMDTKQYHSEFYFQNFKTYFISKYKNTQFDLIISTDNAAFNFLVKYRNELTSTPPVVFCGLNYVDSIPPTFTGIIEDIDIFSNIRSILELHPGYKKLYLVIDRSTTGNVIRKKTEETIARSFPDLRYEYLTDYSYANLKDKFSHLTPDDIVLLIIFNVDSEGRSISHDHILDEIYPVCKAPIYGTWDFYLNKGIVGGKITKAASHGEAAADIALQILKGASVASIPVKSGPNEYVYDNHILKQFKINKTNLPQGSIILNTRYSFLKKNLELIAFTSALFLLMLVVIFVLIKLFSKEKQIRKKEQKFLMELKNKSEELENALQEAEKSNQLKSAFLSNLSHEIRTPMNAIVGFSDLLMNNINNKKQEEYISIIKASSNQLLSIINDIIEMSIIDTNQVSIHFSSMNINQVINEVCASSSVLFDSNPNIVIKKYFPLAGNDAIVVTDETKFRQILSNLVSNAFKFTARGYVEIGYFLARDYLEFYVKDTGIGIDGKYHEEIFERFRRVENNELSLFRGLGIGLTLSQSFVKILGGNIWLHSEPGKGSTFYFTIPYKKAGNIPEIAEESGTADQKSHIILVCEDDDNNLLYFKELFSNTNTFIIWAKNGKEAVRLCRENTSIDLVLMDLKMPEMNGWDATKIIKTFRPDLPVIAQTAHALALETNQLINQGFDDYVTKPIKKNELFEKIYRLLN